MDLPGFEDNDDQYSIEYDICTSFEIKKLIETCKSFKIVLLIDGAILQNRGQNLKEILMILQKL